MEIFDICVLWDNKQSQETHSLLAIIVKYYREFKARSNAVLHNEPHPVQPIRLMWSSAFDPIKFDWFYLERLRRSSRLASREERLKTDFGSNADFHMSRTKRIITDNQS